MGLITKEVEVRPTGKMIQYYRDKGYDAKHKQLLIVKVEDLPRKSFIHVDVLCDNCGDVVCTPTYMDYLNSIEKFGNYVCAKCGTVHIVETFMNKYGVSSPAKLEDTIQKMKRTMIARYGVQYFSQSTELREKTIQTWQQKYGVDNPAKDNDVKKKTVQTCRNIFGVDHPAQSFEVRKKMCETFYANSSQKASKQQCHINNLYQGILNYPIKYYNVDIYLPNDNLVVEYDGGGHMLNVVTGRETLDEYNHKEIVRYNVIKYEGYKQMRIISSRDLLPSDSILLQMLDEARNYFSTTSHSWITYDIDQSLMFNAEHKDGIHYSYGELRTIKEVDLQNSQNLQNINTAAQAV